MIKKEFIPYNEALELKALGFDEPCFTYYKNDQLSDILELVKNSEMENVNNEVDNYISAPTFSQAFRWFRDKKLSDMCICRYQSRGDGGIYYYYHITHDFGVEETKHFKEGFISYEEAELACLRKLIEMTKGQG